MINGHVYSFHVLVVLNTINVAKIDLLKGRYTLIKAPNLDNPSILAASSKDFGKNVIPAMLNGGEKMFAYPFDDYWKDVGTLQSLWEANMDLLGETPQLDLSDNKWKISYRHYPDHPHFIGKDGKVQNSVIAEGCEIHGTVINSVLFSGVTVEKGAVIKDSVIMSNTYIKQGASIDYSIIDVGAYIGENAKIGEARDESIDLAVIGNGVKVQDEAVVHPGEIVDGDIDLQDVEVKIVNGVANMVETAEIIHINGKGVR